MRREAMVAQGSRALRGASLVFALWSSGLCAALSGDGIIPPELQGLAAACRENSARIESLQMSGTLLLTGRRFEGQWDPIANKTYNSRTRVFSLWKDARNCRFDVSSDREVNETGEVHYNVPYGEHLMNCQELERQGGKTELNRKYGTPQSTRRMLVTPDGSFVYRPEENQLVLESDGVMGKISKEKEVRLAFNHAYGAYFTTAELVDRWTAWAQQGSSAAPQLVEVIPFGEGQYQIRATIVESVAPNAARHHVAELVVDLDQGGNVISYAGHTDDRIYESARFQYTKAGGAWILVRGEISEFGPDGILDSSSVYEVAPESVRVNEPIDKHAFTFEALAVRKGAHVTDHKTGEQYLYDDMPLHIKAALARARAEQEGLADAVALAAQSGASVPIANESAPNPRLSPAGAAPPASNAPGQRAQAEPSPLNGRLPIPHGAPDAGAAPTETTPTQQSGEAQAAQPPEGAVATRPATRPTATRPIAARPEPRPPTAQAEVSQPPAPAAAWFPSATATAVAVTAGCVAALAIGLWKWRSGARTPRP
jgi:hypothetical protein